MVVVIVDDNILFVVVDIFSFLFKDLLFDFEIVKFFVLVRIKIICIINGVLKLYFRYMFIWRYVNNYCLYFF